MIFPGFVGPSAPGFTTAIATDRLINWFPELVEAQPNGKNKYVLLPSPGFTSFTGGVNLAAAPAIHWEAAAGRLFALGNNKLYEIASNGTATDRGALNATTNVPAYITSNGTQLFIVANSAGYTFTLNTNTLSAAIAGLSASDADFCDGFFLATYPSTQKFFISGLYDGATWNALDFASVEALPDNLVRVIANSRQLWCLGQESIQVYTNTGNADFPFEPIAGAVLEQGCIAKGSVAKIDNSVFWLGGDGNGAPVVFRSKGFSAERISTHAMEHAITSTSWTNSDAIAMTYVDRGHAIYQIYFPTAAQTWRYDCSTGLWHEAGQYISGVWYAAPPKVHAFAFNKHIIGTWNSTDLFEMSETLYTNISGLGERRERWCPHLTRENKRTFYSSFELDMETGVGNGSSANPVIQLAWSNDGGYNFNAYISKAIGASGAHPRVRWPEARGSARDRVYKVMCDEPVKAVITNAYLDLV